MIRTRHRGARRAKDQKRRTAVRRTLAFGLACTLVTGVAWGYWSTGSVPGGNGQAQAATVGQGNTPTTTVAGDTVTVSWAASTLSNGQAVNGYKVKRYSEATHVSQTILSACTGHLTLASCVESNVPSGDWVYTVTPVFATNWLGRGEPGQRPGHLGRHGAGQRHLAVRCQRWSLQDREHGLLPRRGGGLVAAQQRRGRPRLGPGLERDRSPGRNLHRLDPLAVHGLDTGGWTVRLQPLQLGGRHHQRAHRGSHRPRRLRQHRADHVVVRQRLHGSDGQHHLPNGYPSGTSVTLTLTATDGGSGIASRQIQRASAPLSGTTCGTFTSFTNLGAVDPTSPYTDTTVTNGNCYKYQYVVTDLVGNQSVATSANVAKVGAGTALPQVRRPR